MSVSRQRQLQIDKRRMQVAELALKGCRQVEIAERLGVAQATVCSDLKRLRAQWQAAAVADIHRAIVRQLDKLSLLEREAWDAWERSKQPSHVSVVYRDGDNETTKMRQTLKHETGDARYLDQIQKCLAAARALLGLADARKSSAAADGAPRELTAAQLIQAIVFNDRFHAAPDAVLTEADAPLFPDPHDNAAFESAYSAAATAASQGKVAGAFEES